MNDVVKTLDLGGETLTIKSGWMAKQASGAAYVQYGETAVFGAVVGSDSPRPGIDFFPLTVDYREKAYAAGKIPGGFFKREGRPAEKEILTCRLIDRPIRPCFPEGYKNEVQVQLMTWSHDQENDPDVLAINAAMAALAVSDVPFNKILAGVRVGRIDGEFIVNPTYDELGDSDLDLVLVGSRDDIVMVEGSALEVTEEDMLEALAFGHSQMQPIIDAIEELQREIGKEKRPVAEPEDHSELQAKVEELVGDRIRELYAQPREKHELYGAIGDLKTELIERFCPEGAEDAPEPKVVSGLFKALEAKILRRNILDEQRRADGRAPADIRPIDIQVGMIPRTHGSALFTRGETQALVTATLGTTSDEQIMDVLEGEYKKKFLLHYNFPPFCVGETRRIMGPGRREIGHGALAERALRGVLPPLEEFPYTIRIVSEILESNGSSSMASVCGGSLALMDAGVPIIAPVAGIAMGLIKEGDEAAILTDILGVEDHLGDMDFKVTGTEEGITAFQMDLKIEGISSELMAQALEQAREGRLHVLGKMADVLPEPRAELSRHAPKIAQLTIPREKIRDLIGPGGKIIRSITEMTGAQIDVDDDGIVTIAAVDQESAEQAIDMVRSITEDPEVGARYVGRVTRTMRFGAFVEILPGKEGMVHISDLAEHHVERVEDVCNIGDELDVVVKEIDPQGRLNLVLAGIDTSNKSRGRREGGDERDRGGRGRGGRDGGRDGGRRGGRGGRGGGGGRERGERGERGDRGGRGPRAGGEGRGRGGSRGGPRDERRGNGGDDDDSERRRGGRRRGSRGGRGRRGGGEGGNGDEGRRAAEAEPRSEPNLDWYERDARWDREERPRSSQRNE